VHPLPLPPLIPKLKVALVYPDPPTIEVVPVISDVIVIVGVLKYPVPPALVIVNAVITPDLSIYLSIYLSIIHTYFI
jgi:hypothetical protein